MSATGLIHGDGFAIEWSVENEGCGLSAKIHETTDAGEENGPDRPLFIDVRTNDPLEHAHSDAGEKPAEGGHVLEARLNWDGCVNLWLAKPEYELHFCGLHDCWLGRAMEALYALGPKMPRWNPEMAG